MSWQDCRQSSLMHKTSSDQRKNEIYKHCTKQAATKERWIFSFYIQLFSYTGLFHLQPVIFGQKQLEEKYKPGLKYTLACRQLMKD